MKKILVIIFLINGLTTFSQKCRFTTEENIEDVDNRIIETNDVLIDGLAPNNLSISFLQSGNQFFVCLDYLFLDNSGVTINGVGLPKSQFPKISLINKDCLMIFTLMNGTKVTVKAIEEQVTSKRNLTKASTEYKIKDLKYPIQSEDLILLQNELIDKVEIQFFKQSEIESQSLKIQVSEMRDTKIKNYITCLLNY
jgi:hypothetical protein